MKYLVLCIGILAFSSCSNPKAEVDELHIAKSFYAALDNSNSSAAQGLIADTLKTIDDGFEQQYSGSEFTEWMKWDAVFQPTYEILSIEAENGIVKVKISKTDKRIAFLHQEPIVTEETLVFEGNRIRRIERNSTVFNVERFVKNRDELVNWITKTHPELDGFLNDQTQSGGEKYLRAIGLYLNIEKR